MSTFGEELRRERELRKISLREISEATKINIRYLEALERNDFRHLPGGVFNKGFVRAFAQYIGVDPEAMVNAYLLEEQQQSVDQPRADGHWIRGRRPRESSPPVEPAVEAPPASGRRLLTAAVAVVLLLALVSFGAWWFWIRPATREPVPGAGSTQAGTVEPAPGVGGPGAEPLAGSDPPAAAERRPADGGAGPPAESVEAPATAPGGSGGAPPIAAPGSTWTARVRLDRMTDGRVNCDNRRVEVLDGLAPGTELTFECSLFLLIRAADGGAVMVGIGDEPLSPLGEDGVAVEQRRMGRSRGEVNS